MYFPIKLCFFLWYFWLLWYYSDVTEVEPQWQVPAIRAKLALNCHVFHNNLFWKVIMKNQEFQQ